MSIIYVEFCKQGSAQALREAALLCQLRHPQQSGEEPLLWGQERPHPTTQIQAHCEYPSQYRALV